MQQRDQSNKRCPRCGQVIEFRLNGTIKPHTAELVGARCLTAGMLLGEAREWVDAERAKIKAMTS